MQDKRIVQQWVGWQLICVEEEEYLLARHDGFDIDFDASDDDEAIQEALRLMHEIEDGPTPPA